MSKERLEEIKEPFANLEKIKVDLLKGKILDGLDEFKNNKGRQWTELRFEKPLLEKLLSTIEQAERVQELDKALTIENRLHVKANQDANRLDEQVSRYREAMYKAIDRSNAGKVLGHIDSQVAKILREALEDADAGV